MAAILTLSILVLVGSAAIAQSAANAANDLGLDPAVAARLSQEQLFELLREREQTRQVALSEEPPLVAIVVPVAMFLMLFGAIAATLHHRFRKDRERHETIRRMVDKGVEVPTELVLPPAPPSSDLRRGILLLAGGVGLAIFLRLVGGVPPRLWTAGLVPILLGIGYLVAWRLESPRRDSRGATA